MKCISLKEIFAKYGLKNEATSNVKILEISQQLDIPSKVCMCDDKCISQSIKCKFRPVRNTLGGLCC